LGSREVGGGGSSSPVGALGARRPDDAPEEAVPGRGEEPLRYGHPGDNVVAGLLLEELDDEAPGVLLLLLGLGRVERAVGRLEDDAPGAVPAPGDELDDPRGLGPLVVAPGRVALRRADDRPLEGVRRRVDDDAVAGRAVGEVAPVEPEARRLQVEEVEPRVLGLDQPWLVNAARHLGGVRPGRPLARRARAQLLDGRPRGSQALVHRREAVQPRGLQLRYRHLLLDRTSPVYLLGNPCASPPPHPPTARLLLPTVTSKTLNPALSSFFVESLSNVAQPSKIIFKLPN
jgi:hypothetical protein